MPAPVPADPHSVPALEAAIVATEQVLSERLAHLSWCRTVGRNSTVAENLVRSAELRLEGLWRERDWRLADGQDGPA